MLLNVRQKHMLGIWTDCKVVESSSALDWISSRLPGYLEDLDQRSLDRLYSVKPLLSPDVHRKEDTGCLI